MTLETGAITALSAVTGALVYVSTLMLKRLTDSENKIKTLEGKIENLQTEINQLYEENGHANAKVEMFEKCPKKKECPFYNSPEECPVFAR